MGEPHDQFFSSLLSDAFEQNWPKLNKVFRDVLAVQEQQNAQTKPSDGISERDTRDMFGEILELLRTQERRVVAEDAREDKSLVQQINARRKNIPLVHQIVVHWTESDELLKSFCDYLMLFIPEVAKVTPDVAVDPLDGQRVHVVLDPPVKPSRADGIVADAAVSVGVRQPMWLITST